MRRVITRILNFLWRKSVFNNLNDIHITDNDSKDVYKHSVEYTASSLPRNIGKLGYQFYFRIIEHLKFLFL